MNSNFFYSLYSLSLLDMNSNLFIHSIYYLSLNTQIKQYQKNTTMPPDDVAVFLLFKGVISENNLVIHFDNEIYMKLKNSQII